MFLWRPRDVMNRACFAVTSLVGVLAAYHQSQTACSMLAVITCSAATSRRT
uniref:Putative secreted salivary protein n=1 Tax=Ixodes scapularis TaxID=6945 RepID=Q4PN39_IXOSC|nr:putative secreted salivary protein [Ixodes scapularis]